MKWLARALLLIGFGLNGAIAATEAPADYAKWGVYCFCQTAISTPQKVVKADNNGVILFRLREPAALNVLHKEGLDVSDSQLVLLRTFDLIKRQDDGAWATTIPAFGPEVMEPLRDRIKAIAARIAPQVASDAKAIGEMMTARGYNESAYAVVFGHGLDGTTWDMLRARNALPSTVIDRDHPLWAGAFWAAFPARTGVPGTNAKERDNATVMAVWTDATLKPVADAAEAADIVATAAAASQGTASSSPVPLIYDGDLADLAAKRIGAVVASALLEDTEMQDVLGSLPVDRHVAMLVVAHEFVWDLLDELVAAGAVTPPSTLSGTADPGAVRALIFILVKPKI